MANLAGESLHHTGASPSGSRSTTGMRTPSISDHLPFLPAEIQVLILIHIPPNQLFTLRQVSHAWNCMLQNPHLLDDVNRQLPFLSSAPDLTSRMKRRMRMIRKNPVWIASFPQGFPRIQKFLDSLDDTYQWDSTMTKFWNGYIVVVAACFYPNNVDLRAPEIKIKIQNLRERDESVPSIEVDLMDIFKKMNPEGYTQCLIDCSSDLEDQTYAYGTSFIEFNVQAGYVVLVLQGAIHWSPDKYSPIDDTYSFFIFSIQTGDLIQYLHIHRPFITNQGEEDYVLSLVSETHLLVLFGIESKVDSSVEVPSHRICIYSLHDGSPLPEMFIIFGSHNDLCNHISNMDLAVESGWSLNVSSHILFDNLGQVWLARVHGRVVAITTCTGDDSPGIAPAMTSNSMGSTIKISLCNLPQQDIWAIVPAVSELGNCKELHPSRASSLLRLYNPYRWIINSYQSKLCTVGNRTSRVGGHSELEALLVKYPGSVHIFAEPGNRDETEGGSALWTTIIKTQTFGVSTPGRSFHSNIASPTYVIWEENPNLRFSTAPTLTWGFLQHDLYNSLAWPIARALSEVVVLPFHGNDIQQKIGKKERSERRRVQGMELPDSDVITALECEWADDGLIGCTVNTINLSKGNGRGWSSGFWVACYEEEWFA